MIEANREAMFNGAGLGAVWTFIGIGNWAEASQVAETLSHLGAWSLSVLLIGHFIWRKMIRPWFVKRGKLPRPARREDDPTDSDYRDIQ